MCQWGTQAIETLKRKRHLHSKLKNLSERENQVLDGILQGKSSKLIAIDLNLSPKTIDNYRASVMEKMQADNLAQLVKMVAKDI